MPEPEQGNERASGAAAVTQEHQRSWQRTTLRLCQGLLLLAVPWGAGVGAVTFITNASYLRCSGVPYIATTYHYYQLMWLLVLPFACWLACLLSEAAASRRSIVLTFGERLSRRALVSVAVAVVYAWFSVRYFTVDAHGCVDGLPPWWPPFLPAR